MAEFSWEFPYPSRRMPVLADNVVATSQPLAAQAGLAMLYRGGNAVDAALAAAIALTVVEPTMNGIGSDAFAIVADQGQLLGLNASGRAPATLGAERFAGLDAMPELGWDAVTVPGAVSAWVALSKRLGKLPFDQLFEPALRYAADGFLVGPVTAQSWAAAAKTYAEFPEFARGFLPQGRAPKAGERFSYPDQARTLERIADSGGADFYRGQLAESIAASAAAEGALMRLDDLATHQVDWVEPIALDYGGVTLHEIPPNGQGLAALIALGILRHWELANYPPDSADSLHVQIEAMKLALADAYRYIGDANAMAVGVEDLLGADYLAERAAQIDLSQAGNPLWGEPAKGDTVYLTAADAEGMMVSFIQSNFKGFGSGVVVPNTGISLQNRGSGFSLEAGHPNQVAGAKRPFHTIIPGFISRGGKPLMSFGVMGGPMQAQGHVQMTVRLADYRQNPQAAADAPRWQVLEGMEVGVEAGFGPQVLAKLRSRGHQLTVFPATKFGGAQLIYQMGDGYCAASEPRKEGQAVGF